VLIASGNIAGILLGAGLLLLPAVGAWALVREVIFGARIQRMAQELDAQGKLPEDTLPRSPSGRVDREAASVELEKFADVLEANPDSWEAWFNLSCMYDVCGERKHARAAMRNAISLRRGRGVTDLK
jgi:tetratricopeptide repeat protein